MLIFDGKIISNQKELENAFEILVDNLFSEIKTEFLIDQKTINEVKKIYFCYYRNKDLKFIHVGLKPNCVIATRIFILLKKTFCMPIKNYSHFVGVSDNTILTYSKKMK